MSLPTISLVFVLLGLFSVIAAANDTSSSYKRNILTNVGKSCIFGVEFVSIVLFTSNNVPEGQVVKIIESCDLFDPLNPVIFVTHGFIASADTFNTSIFVKPLIENNYTIFVLDWSQASCYNDPAIINLLKYPFAEENTRKVGELLASFIKSLMKVCKVKLNDITLVGHSLGAHISGFAAKNLNNTGYGKPPLLIGIDPAKPLFQHKPCEYRFCNSDAKRVEALHTSGLGMYKSVGHLDLWFNNGLDQPTCDIVLPGTGALNIGCSHSIGIYYLVNTLLPDCEYVAFPIPKDETLLEKVEFKCTPNETPAYIIVNNNLFDSNYNRTGDYCVIVSSKYPYCMYREQL
ncbi:PREDICTED: phospholipase A1-like [Vollenhovia emeryi]|uniref:phospholipase A1-like n=1 Tax=Vollenhovia emeryi TaxID=411798 RepID=UPI0005F53A7A|nr:PREDICTED: phospholipase A1-like [Vollenhovia emeryi]